MPAVLSFAVISLAPALLVGLGAVLGGGWIWAALVYMTLGAWAMDRLAAPASDATAPVLDGAPTRPADHLSVALAMAHFALLALVIGGLAQGGYGIAGWIALFYTAGLFFGQVSNSIAHELIHRTDRRLHRLGQWIYVSLLFGHHVSAHLKVHHRHAATPDDPNTARAGESFYRFAPRAWRGSFHAGYRAERADIMRRGTGGATPYVGYVLGGLGFAAAAVLVFGPAGLATYLGLAAFAQTQLLLSDYVQHYGLARAAGPDGRPEPIGPAHSWNGPHRFTGGLMLNAPLHSDHHTHPARRFDRLALPPETEAPRLPAPLPAMALLAFYPEGFRRVMARARARWDAIEGTRA